MRPDLGIGAAKLLLTVHHHGFPQQRILDHLGVTLDRTGGATLDHEDPRVVYLSRTIGNWNQVEQWFTPDSGRTWTHRQLTSDPSGYAIRPVTPRGLGQAANRILYVWGDQRTIGFTNYTTRVHALDF